LQVHSRRGAEHPVITAVASSAANQALPDKTDTVSLETKGKRPDSIAFILDVGTEFLSLSLFE
jgi:hypothetical protein